MKQLIRYLTIAGGIALLLTCVSQPKGNPNAPPFLTGGELVFEDTFDGKALDETKWNIETGTGGQYGLGGWGNNERQFYDANNVYLKDGVLHLEARKDNTRERISYPYTSGKISTGGIMNDDGTVKGVTFALSKGRVEARIKSSKGEGLWPAFWLIGANSNQFGGYKAVGWPACGEIDILEIRGGMENRISSTIHYGMDWENYRAKGDFMELDINLADDWHVYGVAWDELRIHFLFDGEIWQSIDMGELEGGKKGRREAFTAKSGMVININLAVGGDYIAGKLPPDSVFEPDYPAGNRCLMVDWVRAYRQ